MEDNMEQLENSGLDAQCTCLFCGESFPAREIAFCINRNGVEEGDWYDRIYEEHIRAYKGCEDVEAPYRQWVEWANDPARNVLVWEEEGSIPAVVEGPLQGDDGKEKIASAFGFDFFSSNNAETEAQTDASSLEPVRKRYESSCRVCPKCHMSLPEGFARYPVVRIGLLGGPRSGKTTYMTVVSEYLRNKFGELDHGMELGDVSFVEESESYLEHLYEITSRENVGLLPTVIDDGSIRDTPVLPIVMLVTPHGKYQPFYLILQDIPGEYLRSEFKDQLAASSIRASTDLILLFDINHIARTRQQESNEWGEYCRMEIIKLFDNLRNLGMRMNKRQLTSIQLALTKLDILTDPDAVRAFSPFLTSADIKHTGFISQDRLNEQNNAIRKVLSSVGGHDWSHLLDTMQKKLGLSEDAPVEKAYTAIASRNLSNVAFSGMDYNCSVNVLEPILNILSWHKLLPTRKTWR